MKYAFTAFLAALILALCAGTAMAQSEQAGTLGAWKIYVNSQSHETSGYTYQLPNGSCEIATADDWVRFEGADSNFGTNHDVITQSFRVKKTDGSLMETARLVKKIDLGAGYYTEEVLPQAEVYEVFHDRCLEAVKQLPAAVARPIFAHYNLASYSNPPQPATKPIVQKQKEKTTRRGVWTLKVDPNQQQAAEYSYGNCAVSVSILGKGIGYANLTSVDETYPEGPMEQLITIDTLGRQLYWTTEWNIVKKTTMGWSFVKELGQTTINDEESPLEGHENFYNNCFEVSKQLPPEVKWFVFSYYHREDLLPSL